MGSSIELMYIKEGFLLFPLYISTMQHLRLLHIQGPIATSFALKGYDRDNFIKDLQPIFKNKITFISSGFRSDLFYESPQDQSELIVKKWCDKKNQPFSNDVLNRMSMRYGKEPVFEHYFYKLLLFTSNKIGFTGYCTHFNELLKACPKSEILRSIRACNLNIIRRMKGHQESVTQLSRLGDSFYKADPNQSGVISVNALSGFNPN